MKSEIMEKLLEGMDEFYAHCKEENGEVLRETLPEHTRLTSEYFRMLWDRKKVREMVSRFQKQMAEGISEEGKAFWEEILLGIPVFHDMGKLNPDFQSIHMKSGRTKKAKELTEIIGTRHSLLSAVLYLDYYLKRVKEVVKEKEEKKLLKICILLHSYVISRHHSDLCSFQEFLEDLEENKGKAILEALGNGVDISWNETFALSPRVVSRQSEQFYKYTAGLEKEESIGIYAYVRLMYSMLVAADFYATSEFMAGAPIYRPGDLTEEKKWADLYENTDLLKKIRKIQIEVYPHREEELREEKDINILRTEMFCDAEKVLKQHVDSGVFYLEAPTGSGKSNTALNLSLQLMKEDTRLCKVFYIYPFNTLIEQNIESLKNIYGKDQEIFQNIAVINSVTPIKLDLKAKEKEEETEYTLYYQKALLDRQFLNYPMILSTHVSLFDMMFGDRKESVFGFHQLMNSIVILDEIQSYNNQLWGEISYFLKEFAYLMNIKIVIMSATLPDFDKLTNQIYPAVRLMENQEKYFQNPCFRNRVKIFYELLDCENIEDALTEHIRKSSAKNKKILVEFIKKGSAYKFFQRLLEDEEISCDVEYMSGDDSVIERRRILEKIKSSQKGIILVATQVIEAGVDIDMDIGYKNISKLDSEEQFMGRINRSCKREGEVYFFKLDDGKEIYKGDVRIQKPFTLENQQVRELLREKDFGAYYDGILEVIKRNFNDNTGETGLKDFFQNQVGKLDWPKVRERMELIPDDNWSMQVFLAHTLTDLDGKQIDGWELWNTYKRLLQDTSMSYPEKKVKLSEITSQMNYFLYQIKKNVNLQYSDKIGEIFCIEDGEKFFDNGKLNREKIQGEVGDFIDFI